jgi:hypothetical protein
MPGPIALAVFALQEEKAFVDGKGPRAADPPMDPGVKPRDDSFQMIRVLRHTSQGRAR